MKEEKQMSNIVKIHFDQVRKKALVGQVFVFNGEKDMCLTAVDIRDAKFEDGKTVGEVIDSLQDTIQQLVAAYNNMVALINDNQNLTTAAINDLRSEVEKGKVF